jgi:hypothetical protein
MSFWSGEKLGVKLPTLVDPYDSAKVDCAAYKKLGSKKLQRSWGQVLIIASQARGETCPQKSKQGV